MTTEMVQAAETAAMPANGTGAKADAKAAAAAEVTANGSPSQANGKGSAPPSTEKPPGENGAEAPADSEAAAKAKEEEAALRKKEDEVLAKGAEIAGVRALLARAYSKPAEEPLRAPTTWTYVLEEAAWMAADFSQERLWRHTAALAVAFEIAKKGGDFDLKQPPKEFRKYSDEIRELRLAAVKTDAPPPSSSRRASARATPQPPQASTFLALDPESDPGIKWLEEGAAIVPGTPPLDDLSKALAFPCDEEFVEALGKHLMTSEVDRLIKEEIAYRSYRLEYEASLVSHQLAVAEQTAAANTIDLGLGASFGIEGMEDGTSYGQAAGAKKSNKRRKTGGAARSGGFLGLDDFGVEEEDGGYGNKRSATSKAALVEDVYLRKRRPQRPAAYRDVDADYDVGVETGTRYGTRRATGALARNQARMAAADRNRRVGSGRADAYQQQQAARARAQGQGMPGTVVWQKAEEDLLLAVVHEFGVNWTLVSEVLSLSLRMQGVHRPAAQCRQRFRILTVRGRSRCIFCWRAKCYNSR